MRYAYVLLLLIGCNEGSDLGHIAPILNLNPTFIDFGTVPTGATKWVRIDLSNTGMEPLLLERVETTAPFTVTVTLTRLAPGQHAAIEVAYAPSAAEEHTGAILLATNDPKQPELNIPIQGNGAPAMLSARPRTISLEETSVGTIRTAEIILEGNATLSVPFHLSFDRPEHFRLADLTSDRVEIPNGEAILTLEYQPFEQGPDRGFLFLEVCGERCGLPVEIQASAVAPAVQLTPQAIQFGQVAVSDQRTVRLLVNNRGQTPIQIGGIGTTGDAAFSATFAPGETIEASDSMAIEVLFDPSRIGRAEGAVFVEIEAPIRQRLQAPLSGSAVNAFSVQPERLDFGIERRPGEYRRMLLLINSGANLVQVTGITIAGDPELSLNNLPAQPSPLASGQSITIQVLFSPQQVGEHTATVVIRSDDPDRREVSIPIRAGMAEQFCDLELAPSRVGFGIVPVGSDRRLSVLVTNRGSDTCTVLSGSFEPVDPTITLLSSLPERVEPDDSFILDFEYRPTAAEPVKVDYVLRTDDAIFFEHHLSVVGTGGEPTITLLPDRVDFGVATSQCQRVDRSIGVYNQGSTTAEILSITLVTSALGEISLLDPNLQSRPQIGAGDVRMLELIYVPDDVGRDIGLLQIEVRDHPFPLVVPVEGAGRNGDQSLMRDVFRQGIENSIDFLFVIDNSGSMADEQAALGLSFSRFIEAANLPQIDFQIGITTTTRPGHLVGPILDNNTPDLSGTFARQANVGTSGCGFEKGLATMEYALGLYPLRPGAALAVTIVSDEDDQSPVMLSHYVDFLADVSGNRFNVATVTGGPSGCPGAEPAPRYEAFTQATAGMSLSICDDWDQTLTTLGGTQFGLRSIFQLSTQPDHVSGIQVMVDGAPTDQWRYDASNNAIVFFAPPAEDSEIAVEYLSLCTE